jgi:hypothetical protein
VHLLADDALTNLVLADAFGVPHTTTGAELQQRPRLQPCSLNGATGSRAVAGTGSPGEQIPDVVESSVRVSGIATGPLGRDRNGRLVDEDEGVDRRIRDARRT